MIEEIKGLCREPDCRYPATRIFNGMKLCKDCWEKYKEEESRKLLSLQGKSW